MSPRTRLLYGLVISVMAHFFLLVSIYGKGGGRSGPLRFPGKILIELVNLSATSAKAGVAASSLPEKPQAPEIEKQEPKPKSKPRVRPSLTTEKHQGDYAVRDRSDTDDDRAASSHDSGLVPDAPAPPVEGDPSAVIPDLSAPAGPGPGPDDAADVDTASEPAPAVRPAQCAACPPPAYPPLALERGLEGRVVLSVQVLPDGNVGDVFIVESPGFPLLEETAITAVKTWTFYPATTEDGDPVASQKRVTIPFVLTYK